MKWHGSMHLLLRVFSVKEPLFHLLQCMLLLFNGSVSVTLNTGLPSFSWITGRISPGASSMTSAFFTP